MKITPVVLSVAAVALATLLTACASAPPKTDAVAETPAAPAAPHPTQALVISDFEDATQPVVTYAGPKSRVKVEYQSELVHGGKMALKVSETTYDWAGALLTTTEGKGDWNGYSALHFWVYGTNSGDYFNIDLEDAGAEQFRNSIANNFTGWKEVTIPFTDFPARSDYQAPEARRNNKIDWPLKSVQFFTSSKFQGFLVFDDLTVEP